MRFVDCDLTERRPVGRAAGRCELRDCTLDGLRGAEACAAPPCRGPDIVAAAGLFADALGVRVLEVD